jgi:hypothetical protein
MYEWKSNNLIVLQNVIPNASRWLNQFHDPDLRFRVGLDVSLAGSKVGVSGKQLHVPEQSSDGGYLPRSIGDESAPSAVI